MPRGRRKGGNKEKVFGCDLLEHLNASSQESKWIYSDPICMRYFSSYPHTNQWYVVVCRDVPQFLWSYDAAVSLWSTTASWMESTDYLESHPTYRNSGAFHVFPQNKNKTVIPST